MKTTSLTNSILITAFAVGFIWCFKAFELNFNINLSWLGVYPLALHGLVGIITAPLIHGSLEHIFNNTLPMLVLGSFLIYGYPKTHWRVLITVWLLSGIGVWLFGRESYHIGASGLTHGVFFYLFVVSIFRRDHRSVVLMMLAFFMYGGMTMSIFPRQEGISFEYHLFGALAGVLCACLWHSLDPKPTVKAYSWEVEPKSEDPIIGDQWRLDGQAEDNEGNIKTVPNEKENMNDQR